MNEKDKQALPNLNAFITVAFCAVIGYITYTYARLQILQGGLNDYAAHLQNILPLFRGEEWWKGFMAAPHCLWHLTTLFLYQVLGMPMDAAASYTTAGFVLFYYLVLVWAIGRVTAYAGKKAAPIYANFIAFCFCFVQALHFSWLDAGERYLGAFSMNPIHNPTQMCVRGFALLGFALAADLLGTVGSETYRPIFFDNIKKGKKPYICLAVLLFFSTVMKPTFTEVFVPGVAFYMLKELLCRLFGKKWEKTQAKQYFGECMKMLLAAVPSLLFILLQYTVFFAMEGSYGSEGGMVVTEWFAVWRLFTENVWLSVLLGMAFPIYMLVIDAPYFFGSRMGQIALLSYLTGFVEASILGEEGSRMSHANFIWPLMSGMLLVWVTALFRLLSLERSACETRTRRVLLSVGWGIFAAHVLCGFIFLDLSMKGL